MRLLTKVALAVALLTGVMLTTAAAAVLAEDGMTRVYFVNETEVPLRFKVEGRDSYSCHTTKEVPRCNLLTPSGNKTLVATFDDGEIALTQHFNLPENDIFLWTVRQK